MVLASSEHRLQLVFYHLLASLLTCCRSPPPLWAPRPQQKASLICSWEQPLTPVWLLGSSGGWGEGLDEKNICQRWAGCLLDVTMQLQKAHTGIIFTLLHYFPRAPPGERESGGEYTVRRREKEDINKYIYLWMAGRLPKRVGLNVCENTKRPTFSYAGDVKCSTLKSLFVDITHSRLP